MQHGQALSALKCGCCHHIAWRRDQVDLWANMDGWSNHQDMLVCTEELPLPERVKLAASTHLDRHGLCGAVQPGPQGIFYSINTLIAIASHLNVCRGERKWINN